MNTTSTITFSPRSYIKLPCHHVCLFCFLFMITFYVTSIPCTEAQISYRDHCASFVPESNPNDDNPISDNDFPLSEDRVVGYYSTDDNYQVSNQTSHHNLTNSLNTLSFGVKQVYRTDVEGVFKVEGDLLLWDKTYANHRIQEVFHWRSWHGSLGFQLEGFWSTITGRLCMVGNVKASWREAHTPELDVVLKLNGVKYSVNITSLINGTLESMNTADELDHSEQISLLMVPQNHMDYNYTLVSEKNIDHVCPGGGNSTTPKSYSTRLKLKKSMICSTLTEASRDSFQLHYSSNCKSTNTCNPFGYEKKIGYFPREMRLNIIHCSEGKQSLRLFIHFPNRTYIDTLAPLNYQTTLVGEASWDWKNNWLYVAACRLLNPNTNVIGDCSFRLSLGFPAVLTIRNISSVVGNIWSIKNGTSPGYFSRITSQSSGNIYVKVPGLKYKYTEIGKATNSCLQMQFVKNKHHLQYPNVYSKEKSFDKWVEFAKRAVGYVHSLFVGDDIYYWYNQYGRWVGLKSNDTRNSSQLNVSYKIELEFEYGIKLDASSLNFIKHVEISAEGIYRAETGRFCMVGCRYLGLDNEVYSSNDTMDCDILINIQYPPLNSQKSVDYIQGSIKSTRHKTDPFYFLPLSFTTEDYYTVKARQDIQRMDMEIILSLISNTLSFVFVGFQIFYVKKHRDPLPFASLLMLGVLILGNIFPLVLNFESLFMQQQNPADHDQKNNVLLDQIVGVNYQAIEWVFMMLVLFLQFHLLQQIWSTILDRENQKVLWIAEIKAALSCLSFYITGCFIAWFVNSNKLNNLLRSSSAGLVLDGFLLPQILFNIFLNSKEKALSLPFYVGISFGRLLPHAYDLYRSQRYGGHHLYVLYMYANPHSVYVFSTAWDVIISSGSLVFATIIYFQQLFGGCCMFP